MKLLHIIAGMDPEKGGVGQAVRTMVAGLIEIDVENEVICLDAPAAGFLANINFKIHAAGPGKGPWCYAPGLLPLLNNQLERFDAVILHGLWLYNSYAIRKAMEKLKLKGRNNGNASHHVPKLFIMPHGMLDPYFLPSAF